jgi:hypothetical protein
MFTFGPCRAGAKVRPRRETSAVFARQPQTQNFFVVGKRPGAQDTKEGLASRFADAVLMPELMQGFLVRALAML